MVCESLSLPHDYELPEFPIVFRRKKNLRDTQFVLALRKYHHVIITEMALAKLIKDFNCLGLELDVLLGQLDLW